MGISSDALVRVSKIHHAEGSLIFAHSKEDSSLESWHLLEDHLNSVANRASGFAASFEAQQWAEIAGRTHDLGKGTRAWQGYLRDENGVEDEFSRYYKKHHKKKEHKKKHADVGACYLYQASNNAGKLLSYTVAGHHGGLPSWEGELAGTGLRVRLEKRLPDDIEIPLPSLDFPEWPPSHFYSSSHRFGYQLQFFTRMLFSCLVDADYLDTEQSLDTDKASKRGAWPPLENLYDQFWTSFNQLINEANPNLAINKQRKLVLDDCKEAAQQDPGLFSLTVPTGGGKTLASLAFALEHAKKYGKERIIYVIPHSSDYKCPVL